MAAFAYKGRNGRGDLVEGTLSGDDSGAIADQLMVTGILPIEIKAVDTPGGEVRKPGWLKRFTEKPVTPMDLLLFTRQMYSLLKAGVPIMRALSGLQDTTQHPAFAAIIRDLRESLDSGRELSAAMRRHPKVFSTFYFSMVQIGEMTGVLADTFIRLYDYLEFERDIRERTKTALRYPSFVMLAMAIALVVVNIFVIPAFSRVYAGLHAELPIMTKILIGFSTFMVHYWALLLALLVGAVLGFRFYINTPGGRFTWDKHKFKLPIAGKILLKSTLARFARSLALSVRSGIPALRSMHVVSLVVENEFMRSRIEQMCDGIERGESILRTASASGIFNPIVLQMIAIGEETGDLDGMMFEIAGMYEREVEYEVKTLSAQIEPILIVALGIMALVLALGIFMPMWDLGQAAMH